MPVAKDNDLCSVSKPNPRLVMSAAGGVRYAVVFLEGVRSGKRFDTSARVVLDQRACVYEPHVVLLPVGGTLEIVNSDPILHNVHTYDLQKELTTVFNIAQPLRGQRTPLPASIFDGPGFYRATCDAGHPWMSAYIVVIGHPYYAVTDENGRYVLEGVPPGRYNVRMWHEGVHITRTEMEKGAVKRYNYESPYELVKEVEVLPNRRVTLDFEFELRKVL
jgi:plastocyanin